MCGSKLFDDHETRRDVAVLIAVILGLLLTAVIA